MKRPGISPAYTITLKPLCVCDSLDGSGTGLYTQKNLIMNRVLSIACVLAYQQFQVSVMSENNKLLTILSADRAVPTVIVI